MASTGTQSIDRHDDADITLGILSAVERDPSTTQRSVASELGIAVGLANAYVKRCVRMGLIKVGQAPTRRYAYYLTPRGFAEKSRLTATYLTHSLGLFRIARTQYGELLQEIAARGGKRVVLLGGGELAEIAMLLAPQYRIIVTATVEDIGQIAPALQALDVTDAALVTALNDTLRVYQAAVETVGPQRVLAPRLLRLPTTEDMRSGALDHRSERDHAVSA